MYFSSRYIYAVFDKILFKLKNNPHTVSNGVRITVVKLEAHALEPLCDLVANLCYAGIKVVVSVKISEPSENC